MPPSVSTADFWRAVGEAFLLHRVRLGLDRHQVTKQLRGPDGRTIEQIECGSPGNTSKLDHLARAYGLELTDLFAAVLASRDEAITPEVQRVLRKFRSTTVEGRAALTALATALPDAETPPTPGESPSVPPGATDDTDR